MAHRSVVARCPLPCLPCPPCLAACGCGWLRSCAPGLLVPGLVLAHEQSLVLERREHHPRTQSRCTIHHPVRVSEVETPPHSAAKQSWQQLVLVPVPVPVLAPELVLQLELQAERPSVMLPALVGRS